MPKSNPPNAMTRPQGSVELLETPVARLPSALGGVTDDRTS